ncbi:MAG: hypothetical protein ACLGJB_17675 [Blastocatellia bacterium]
MTDRDLAIKRYVTNFGPLTREQLEELAKYAKAEEKLGAPSKLWRRLLPRKPLIAQKQVYYWEAPFGQKYVYADYQEITKRKDCTHDIITTWVQIILHIFFSLLHWQRGKQKHANEVNEDGFFILGLPLPNKVAEVDYYLESDTGSEGYTQIYNKWQQYTEMLENSEKAFFVLFVCATKERALDLVRCASGKKSKKYAIAREHRIAFLFTYLDALRASPKGAICYVPYENEEKLFTILPPV